MYVGGWGCASARPRHAMRAPGAPHAPHVWVVCWLRVRRNVVGERALMDWDLQVASEAFALFQEHVCMLLHKHNGYLVRLAGCTCVCMFIVCVCVCVCVCVRLAAHCVYVCAT